MPNETSKAVEWAKNQTLDLGYKIVSADSSPSLFVDKVREYFNTNGIEYTTFSYDDLLPFLS